MQVTSGAFSYDQAIRRAIKKVAADGLSVINYASGRQEKLDVAVRRTVLTGVGQTTAELQLSRAREMNQDLIQMLAHIGARPTHEVWQGRIFSISGTSRKYPPFVESTGYGTVTGYAGVNCRHSAYAYFPGISEKIYSQKELDEYANKTVVYNGKEMSVYEATQAQRGIERKIRHWKRQAGALEAAGLDNTVERLKMGEWQAEMRKFVKETGLIRQSEREHVEGIRLRALRKKPALIIPENLPVSRFFGDERSGINLFDYHKDDLQHDYEIMLQDFGPNDKDVKRYKIILDNYDRLNSLSNRGRKVIDLGEIGENIVPIIQNYSSAKMVQATDDVLRHVEKHKDQFDVLRAKQMLPEIFNNPKFIFQGKKTTSLQFIENFDEKYFLMVPVKYLPNELWFETMTIEEKKRFLRRWKKRELLYSRE